MDWIPVSERLPSKDGRYLCVRVFKRDWECERPLIGIVGFCKHLVKEEYDKHGEPYEKEYGNVWMMYDLEACEYLMYDDVLYWIEIPETPDMKALAEERVKSYDSRKASSVPL